ncbi:hypothetical protein EXS57_03695 [Candidatus Kaiserbacteria bacterium]|nr:hypothetical protein [Candidatus Kaiserbacteria bacterium]
MDAVLLVRRAEEREEVVLTVLLQLMADACNFLAILLRRERFIENVILLVLHIHAPEAVFEIFAEDAELTIAAVVSVKTIVAVMTRRTMRALVRPFTFKAVTQVATVFVSVRFDAVETIFESERIMATVTVLTFREMVADTVLAAELMHAEVRRFGAEHLYPVLHHLTLRTALQVYRLHALFVIFLGELLIEDAVLLLVETYASETVAAPKAIFTELAVTTVGAVLAEIRHIAVGAVNALRTPFATYAERQPATADAFAGVACVVDVFRVEDTETVVTIF